MINRLLNVVTYAIYGRISRRSNDNARIGFREARGSLPPRRAERPSRIKIAE